VSKTTADYLDPCCTISQFWNRAPLCGNGENSDYPQGNDEYDPFALYGEVYTPQQRIRNRIQKRYDSADEENDTSGDPDCACRHAGHSNSGTKNRRERQEKSWRSLSSSRRTLRPFSAPQRLEFSMAATKMPDCSSC